jgi:hypothetical protein
MLLTVENRSGLSLIRAIKIREEKRRGLSVILAIKKRERKEKWIELDPGHNRGGEKWTGHDPGQIRILGRLLMVITHVIDC